MVAPYLICGTIHYITSLGGEYEYFLPVRVSDPHVYLIMCCLRGNVINLHYNRCIGLTDYLAHSLSIYIHTE